MKLQASLGKLFSVPFIISHKCPAISQCCRFAASTADFVTIGDITLPIRKAKNPHLVPVLYRPATLPQSVLHHLRWVMQKDILGQDVFLVGPPGSLKRNIIMMYLEMTKREMEYVSLSRDTTESDLKQRRELIKGTATHVDQCAVRAALEGRVLVLDGVERAERNVLPILNNLLENREMQLEDGRFLVAAERFDKLLQNHTPEQLDSMKIIRAHPDFRVVALGLMAPRYRGNPLDPPFRSRFQARDVGYLPYKEHLELLTGEAGDHSSTDMARYLSFGLALKTTEARELNLPDFPLDNLLSLATILKHVPSASQLKLIEKLYPHPLLLSKDGKLAIQDLLKSFGLTASNQLGSSVEEVLFSSSSPGRAKISLKIGSDNVNFEVPCGNLDTSSASTSSSSPSTSSPSTSSSNFVSTPFHNDILAGLFITHIAKDFCIVGSRGCGKSTLVSKFAELLGYKVENIMLYQDMTPADLLQQRTMTSSGDTGWRKSDLVNAALEGGLAVIDGLHRVNPGTLAVLHRLIHDRELTLSDGTRLLRHDRYDFLKENNSWTEEDMMERKLLRIHPSFRIIALSEPPSLSKAAGSASSSSNWLTSELLTCFLYHNVRQMTTKEEMEVVRHLVPNISRMEPVLKFAHLLRTSPNNQLKSLSSALSTRQLVRIARRLSQYPDDDVHHLIHKACLARFLPPLTKSAFEEELESCDIRPKSAASDHEELSCEVKENRVRIGRIETELYKSADAAKIPDVLFYDNTQHLMVMEDMLKDFKLGEHLLLVGNQGVGKNKVADRFLGLLKRPREYIQLHRDTTVQTLTIQPTVHGGMVSYEDSPLVRAVKMGRVLVVDEADKAPTNVTCILKCLLESGEMHLSDGRKIVPASSDSAIFNSPTVIRTHPDFRMIILANRPGFPFLGNDFFGMMGDVFGCHAVDNPDAESELAMLQKYGPQVDEEVLRKVVSVFGELRGMADRGQVSYPFSTREAVAIVKHMQMFPDDGLANVVKNVFDFDTYDLELLKVITEVMQKHGIPVGAHPGNVRLCKEFPLPDFQLRGGLELGRSGGRGEVQVLVKSCLIPSKTLKRATVRSDNFDLMEGRSLLFNEQKSFLDLPLHEGSVLTCIAITPGEQRQPMTVQRSNLNFKGDVIHTLAIHPLTLYSIDLLKKSLTFIDLQEYHPNQVHRSSMGKFHMVAVGNGNVVIHDGKTASLLLVDTQSGRVNDLKIGNYFESKISSLLFNKKGRPPVEYKTVGVTGCPMGQVLFFKRGGNSIEAIDVFSGKCQSITLPLPVEDVTIVSTHDWLITEDQSQRKFLLSLKLEDKVADSSAVVDFELKSIEDRKIEANNSVGRALNDLTFVANQPLPSTHLSSALDQTIDSPNRVMSTRSTFAMVAVGLPDLTSVDLYESSRMNTGKPTPPSSSSPPVNDAIYLSTNGILIKIASYNQLPSGVIREGVNSNGVIGFLEVVDLVNKTVRYVPIPGSPGRTNLDQWHLENHISQNRSSTFSNPNKILLAALSDEAACTVDSRGCVRVWEVAAMSLLRSMEKWRHLMGNQGSEKPLQVTYSRELGKTPTQMPKHGQVDPTGAPHVGGNTFAGGTGGMGTAGLGGVGGPYRLDGGSGAVFQVSDEEKRNVPEEVLQAARQMALRAWKEKLKEIQMTEYDAAVYERFVSSVRPHIKHLRNVLESLQSKGKERQWLRHQTHGDVDEGKLIEGVIGEKGVYKRRGEKEPEPGSPQDRPKHLRIVCDASGSMYRFNGHDGRMDRQLESVLMVMEAFHGYDHKIRYDVYAHSGEGPSFPFVTTTSRGDAMVADDINAGGSLKTPQNDKQRLDVVLSLIAHSQFCLSGDYTLEATKMAIEKVSKMEEVDDRFVIVLSDANLERYGISPVKFGHLLTSDPTVNSYAIFIGSLGDQAQRISKQMPPGRSFICSDARQLPAILQQIFTSSMLSS